MIDQTTVAEPIANGTQPKRRGRSRLLTDPSDGVSVAGGSAQSSEKNKRSPKIDAQINEIDTGLSALFQSVGGIIKPFNEFDGTHIELNSPKFVQAVCRAARQDAKLRNTLLSMVHVSAMGDIVMAGVALMLPIMINHGLIPMRFFTSFGPSEDDDQNN